MRIQTACFASTFPRALICRGTLALTSRRWPSRSTPVLARLSVGRPPPKRLAIIYAQSNNTALRRPLEPKGKRLAESGYSVLVVNPFYRQKPAPVVPAGASFSDPAIRSAVMPLAQALNATTHTTDARAFISWLDTQAAVDKRRKVGTMGYCMGGPMVMRTAAAVPDRVGAGASFHGGGLATKAPDSPHLLIPTIKARFLIAVAENDDQREPEVKTILKDTFAKNNLAAEIEVYAGAAHGWCPPDSAVYNEPQAEKAWARLLALFGKALA